MRKKTLKKLTNVSLVCMYVGRKSEMSVFILFFFPTEVMKNVSFYVVCMYVRPKLTFVRFFFCFFFVHLPLTPPSGFLATGTIFSTNMRRKYFSLNILTVGDQPEVEFLNFDQN